MREGDLLEDQTREALSEKRFFPAARGEQDLDSLTLSCPETQRNSSCLGHLLFLSFNSTWVPPARFSLL